MMWAPLMLAVLFLAELLMTGCTSKAPVSISTKFAVEFRVTNDEGGPMPGAMIGVEQMPLGTTNAAGLVQTDICGNDGQSLPVSVACPEGFIGPDTPSSVRLTHARRIDQNAYQVMRVEAICRRKSRDVVLVVWAQGGTSLPVAVEGKPAGITSTDGLAHVLVIAERSVKRISVSLDTSAHPDLKPQNPSREFELSDGDAVLVFDQAFVAPAKAKSRVTSRSRKYVPYRID